jgi:hypothetical protein
LRLGGLEGPVRIDKEGRGSVNREVVLQASEDVHVVVDVAGVIEPDESCDPVCDLDLAESVVIDFG